MFSLIQAEWTKAVKNYKLTSFLVWVFPVSQVAWYSIIILVGLMSSSDSVDLMMTSSGNWGAMWSGTRMAEMVCPNGLRTGADKGKPYTDKILVGDQPV